ncbi:hypothetical protein Hte_001778 [Hypoxylon texense]
MTSQSPLSISYDCFKLLLSRIQPFPAILQSITSFVGGVTPSQESRGAFDSTAGPNDSELCALFKYVTLNGRSVTTPWSVRKMMVYQKYDNSIQRQVVLLVRAPKHMLILIQEKMTESDNEDLRKHHWAYILMLVCSALNVDWVDYLDHIEKQVWTLANSTTSTNPFNTDSGELDVDLEQGHEFDSLKAGNYWEGLLTRASYALQSNIGVLKALSTEVSRRRAIDDSPSNEQDFKGLVDMISRVERESQFLTTQIDSIRARLSVSLTMIRDCINARAAHHTAMETTYMSEVSARSLREAKATFFGMQFVQTDSNGNISTKPDFFTYLTLTLGLTALTLFGWWVGDQQWFRQCRWRPRPLSYVYRSWRTLALCFNFKPDSCNNQSIEDGGGIELRRVGGQYLDLGIGGAGPQQASDAA